MTAVREAMTLPILFLSVALLGGLRIADRVALLPPPPFALVLSMLLLGLLVRSGALAPNRLLHASRPALANLNGLSVMLTVFLATAQAFNVATPESGLPRVLFELFFLVLLGNTIAASPDRVRVLRSLLVIFASAFILKFIVLAAVSNPADGVVARALQAMFEGVTLGAITQPVFHPATSYVAFCTLTLYVYGLTQLPAASQSASRGRGGPHSQSLALPARED